MKPFIIKHGRVRNGMHQKDIDTYIRRFINLFYEHADPDLKTKENFVEIKANDFDYLHTCDTIHIERDNQGNYIGGYAINIVRPLRYFDVNNYYDKYESRILPILNNSGIDEERDICEITMIWKSRDLNSWRMNIMYASSLWDAYRTGKKIIVGGSVHVAIAQRFKKILTNTLFFGDVKNTMFEGTELGLVLFQHRRKLIGYFILSLIDLLMNTRLMLMVFGKKNIPMQLPKNMSDFISVFQNKIHYHDK